ncbi:MAG: hypothetical protein Q8P12_00030 [bacterium]|nr:hypothetical protein [bacterium]
MIAAISVLSSPVDNPIQLQFNEETSEVNQLGSESSTFQAEGKEDEMSANRVVYVLEGRVPTDAQAAFRRLQESLRVQWGIIGQVMYAWTASSTEGAHVEEIARKHSLVFKKHPLAAGEAETSTRIAVEAKSSGPAPAPAPAARPVPVPRVLGRKRGGPSKRPSDAEFLESLTTRGVEDTAKHYGVEPGTVKNLWAKQVEGAKALIPDGRKERWKRREGVLVA